MGFCAFDMFFTRNVPHILEKIFFSLDYESYKTCLEVSNDWIELLTSESYRRKAKTMFKNEILKDEKNLWKAARDGKIEEVTRLLSGGMLDINCVNGSSAATPLWHASYNGHKNVAILLLKRGAEINMSGIYGYTPLHMAAFRGHIDVVELLLDNGAEVDIKDKCQETPIYLAAQHGHPEIVQL